MTLNKKIALASVFAVLAGYAAYTTIVSYYFANEFSNSATAGAFQEILSTAGLFTYGTVVSTNTDDSSLVFSYINPTTGDVKNVTLLVSDQTLIEHEALIADDSGTYVSLSPLTPGTIDDLTPGTNIAVTFKRSGNQFLATSIFFGDPL